MANSWKSTLLALGPDHYWDLSESFGDLVDTGDTGGFDLEVNGPSGNIAEFPYQAPGMCVRGTPRSFGIIKNNRNSSPFGAFQGGVATVSHDTGVWGCWFMVLSNVIGDDLVLLATTFTDSNSLNVQFRLDINYSLIFEMLGTSSRLLRIQVPNGTIEANVPYFACAVQDGTGIRLFLNGVDQSGTTSTAGGITTNDWIADVLVGSSATQTTVGGKNTGATDIAVDASECCVVSEPFIFVNATITDGQISALHSAANLAASADDFYEYVWDLGQGLDQNLKYFGPLFVGANGIIGLGVGKVGADNDQPLDSSFGLSALNDPNDSIVSDYATYRYVYSDTPGNSVFSTAAGDSNWEQNDTEGTIVVFVTSTVVQDGERKIISTYGSSSTNSFEIGLIGSLLGYSFFFRAFVSTTEVYRILSPIYAVGTTPQFRMLTVRQRGDGSGITLFLNDQKIEGATIEISPDIWLVGYSAGSSSHRWGGQQGSASTNNFEPGDMHSQIHINRALTDAEVGGLWDAANGIFAAGNEPPEGGFFDTINETGNELTVNGPGPDHWWRMNVAAAPLDDIGLNDNPVPDGASIVTGGDPTFEVTGPLIEDPTNEAIYLDGQGDYFEIGADFLSGELDDSDIGTIGFFVSRNDELAMIAYSQGNELATAFLRIGVNTSQQVEFAVQTSAGNIVTFTSSVTIDDLAYRFVVITNDGSNYLMYIAGVLDASATVVETGTGLEGDWFDSFTATRSAIGALASSSFPTVTNGRFSEIFIYDEVLSASQIAALFAAAIADGLGSSATDVGVLVFEDVTFLNGARADILLSNSLTTFSQVLQVNRSRFIGGLEAEAAESISLSGEARASVRGCTFDLGATPTTGRAAIVATTADPTAGASVYGNLLVSNNTFSRMGHGDVTVRPAVFAESGFGMTAEQNRFLDTFVSAIGWRGDARRIKVAHNLIDTVDTGAAAIFCQAGLNTNIGNAWSISKNIILNVAIGNGISLFGANSSAAEFARDIQIMGNNIQTVGAQAIAITQVSDVLEYGNRIGGTVVEGLRISDVTGVIQLLRNFIEGNTGDGIAMDESTTRIATLVIDRNTINASLAGDGMLIDGVDELVLTNNKFLNLVNGLELGNIGSSAKFFGNQLVAVSVPLAFVAATTQTGLEIGQNQMSSLGVAELTVAAETIAVFAQDHTVTLAAPANLATINGFETVEGYVMVLRLAAGSSDVTVVDTDNIKLDAAVDVIMDTPGESSIWLVSDGAGNWNELSRALGS